MKNMVPEPDKLPISVLLAGCNEATLLSACLKSVSFCDDINYVDLESSDNSIEIASRFGANIIKHKRVPVVEIIRAEYFRKLKNEWILVFDPDEVFDEALVADIRNLFTEGISTDVAGVNFPWIFYFKEHRLKGTPWGGARRRVFLMHRDRCVLTDQVHNGRIVNESFQDTSVEYKGNNIVHHYWMSGYAPLIEKHRRYLKLEPETRFGLGQRATLKTVLKTPISAFRYAYFSRLGYKDGCVGLFLSLFWMWYQSRVEYGLYFYQKKQKSVK